MAKVTADVVRSKFPADHLSAFRLCHSLFAQPEGLENGLLVALVVDWTPSAL